MTIDVRPKPFQTSTAKVACLVVSQSVELGGVFEDGVVANGPVKGGLVEAGLGDAQVVDHHFQRVACLFLPVNRLYQPEQQRGGQTTASLTCTT